MRSALLASTLSLCVLSPFYASAQAGDDSSAEPASVLLEGVVPPRPLALPLDYPAGAVGDARVLLELHVDSDGSVTQARALEGDEPFRSFAERQALRFLFTPATERGAPRAARIRLEVSFVQPPPEEAPAVATPAPAAPTETHAAAPVKEPGDTEILVGGERPESTHQLSRAEVRLLPGAFGDPFRAVESLPGVTPIVSGLPYFYVRGAPPGNIGYFLDDVRVPILFHIGAGPSVIHPAFIESVELHAGPFPARYGRFLGGVVAGHTSEPRYETRAEASIRLVDAGAMVETHALDDRLSLMLAGRYSYTAAIISLVAPEIDLSYWDYQARGQYRLSKSETLTVFGFGSLDNATEERPNGETVSIFDLVFHRLNLRYKKALAEGGFWELSALGGVDITAGDADDGISLQDRLLSVGARVERPLRKNLLLRAGFDVQSDHYSVHVNEAELDGGAPVDELPQEEFPDEELPDEGGDRFEDSFPSRTDLVTGAHLDVVWEPERGVRVTPGARLDVYFSGGRTFVGLEPRLLAAFDVGERITLHHGLGLVNQMPSFVIPLPGVQPKIGRGLQHAVQHSAGVQAELVAGIEAKATVFQNIQTNLTDVLSTLHTEEEFEPDEDVRALGSGRGLELLVSRPLSSTVGGYLSYTLSYTERSLGRYSGPSSFDRRHVLGAALGCQLGKGWIFGARGSFYTGVPATFDPYGGGLENEWPSEPPPRPSPGVVSSLPRTDAFWRIDWRLEKRWLLGTEGRWWSLVAEVLNTTLNKEMVTRECSPRGCHGEVIGPVSIPSIGVEASL